MEKMNEQARQMSGLGRMIGKWAQGVALQGNMNKENGWVLSGSFRCFVFPVTNKKDVIQQTSNQFNLKARGAHKHGSVSRVSSEAKASHTGISYESLWPINEVTNRPLQTCNSSS